MQLTINKCCKTNLIDYKNTYKFLWTIWKIRDSLDSIEQYVQIRDLSKILVVKTIAPFQSRLVWVVFIAPEDLTMFCSSGMFALVALLSINCTKYSNGG